MNREHLARAVLGSILVLSAACGAEGRAAPRGAGLGTPPAADGGPAAADPGGAGPLADLGVDVDAQPPAGGGCSACTLSGNCCRSPAGLVCTKDTEGDILCVCPRLWSCDASGQHCSQPLPDPTSSPSWDCSWQASTLVCATAGSFDPSTVPADWHCTHDRRRLTWRCEQLGTANPCNSEAGGAEWSCVVSGAGADRRLSCDRMPRG